MQGILYITIFIEVQYNNSSKMGNQTQKSVSRFNQRYHWLTIAKNSYKEIMQNKLTREIVEAHRVDQADAQQLRRQNLVYEWRKDPQTATYIVEILEISHMFQQQNKNCIAVCQTNNKQTGLVIYTQNLSKLYEMNSKLQLSEGEQIGIIKDIIEGIDLLAVKFGEFIPSKDSVGFNAKKRGKVWINDNYCLNNVQQKRTVGSKQQRQRWQTEVIQTLIDICRLCTTQANYKNNKFYSAIQTIKKNKLKSFKAIRQFKAPQRQPLEQKKYFSKIIPEINLIANKQVDMVNSQYIASSNQFGTAQDPKERLPVKDDFKHINKTFDVGMLSPKRNRASNMSCRTTYNQHNPQLIKFTPKQEKPKPRENNSQLDFHPSFLKPNNIEHNKKNESYILNNVNKLKDANITKQNYNKKEVRQKPAHYALLEELQQSCSSRSSSKMIKREAIPLIDSMQVVEKRRDYDGRHGFHRYKNTVLQQSIIIKAPYL